MIRTVSVDTMRQSEQQTITYTSCVLVSPES